MYCQTAVMVVLSDSCNGCIVCRYIGLYQLFAILFAYCPKTPTNSEESKMLWDVMWQGVMVECINIIAAQ